MRTANEIKEKIEKLYKTNPLIHISVNMTRPKVAVECAEAKLVGVYPNIFRVEEIDKISVFHTVPYTDVLTDRVKIKELEE